MKKSTAFFSMISSILAILLIIGQLFIWYLEKNWGLHYLYDFSFYLVNILIIMLGLLGFYPYSKSRRPLVVLLGFLFIFQGGAMYFGLSHEVIASDSPTKDHSFILQVDKRTGVMAYQRSIYYQYPEIQTWLPKPTKENAYLGFSINAAKLPYTLGKHYKINWPTNELAVFSYETRDGGTGQFIRSYQNTPFLAELTTGIIGNWQSSDQKVQLNATGNPYQLVIDDKVLTLQPGYHTLYEKNAGIYFDEQGNALCTILLADDQKNLTLILANPSVNKSYHLQKQTPKDQMNF